MIVIDREQPPPKPTLRSVEPPEGADIISMLDMIATDAELRLALKSLPALIAAHGPFRDEAHIAEAAHVETLALLRMLQLARTDAGTMGEA
jgi:hypothetical protein